MRVLLIEPNDVIAESLSGTLKKARIHVEHVLTVEDGVALSRADRENSFSALLLGSFENQIDIVKELWKLRTNLPIVALRVMRSSSAAIHLFQAGVDDILVKPFDPHAAAARIFAIKRRMGGATAPSKQVGRLTIYFDGRDPEVDGARIKLSHREFAILSHLVHSFGRVVSKESVYEAVYGSLSNEPFDKVIDVYICKLRKKLADATDGEQFIETVYCRGYKFDTPENTTVQRIAAAKTRKKAA